MIAGKFCRVNGHVDVYSKQLTLVFRFYFYAHLLRLKHHTLNFLFNCEPEHERIDRSDLTDSD